MTPIKILTEEHHLIGSALEKLALARDKLESGVSPPKVFFEKALQFLRSYVFQYHHFKEEHVMFERLAEKKNGALDAQIEALRFQHERGRNLITAMADNLNGYEQGQAIQTSLLLENLAAYISLLRQHIDKEEHIFYPMAEKVFDQTEGRALAGLFEQEEKKFAERGEGSFRDLISEMGALL
jgi:hemerythrin-like domain-containing protein